MANTLKLSRNGAVGFIDWLDRPRSHEITCVDFSRGVAAIAFFVGLRLVKANLVKCEHTVKGLNLARTSVWRQTRPRVMRNGPEGTLRPMMIACDLHTIANPKSVCHRS